MKLVCQHTAMTAFYALHNPFLFDTVQASVTTDISVGLVLVLPVWADMGSQSVDASTRTGAGHALVWSRRCCTDETNTAVDSESRASPKKPTDL